TASPGSASEAGWSGLASTDRQGRDRASRDRASRDRADRAAGPRDCSRSGYRPPSPYRSAAACSPRCRKRRRPEQTASWRRGGRHAWDPLKLENPMIAWRPRQGQDCPMIAWSLGRVSDRTGHSVGPVNIVLSTTKLLLFFGEDFVDRKWDDDVGGSVC